MDLPAFPTAYLPYIVLGVVVLVGLKLLSAILRSGDEKPDIWRQRRCLSCGWVGKVSKHHQRCPKCNTDM